MNTKDTHFGYSLRQQDIQQLTYLYQILAVQSRRILPAKTWLIS